MTGNGNHTTYKNMLLTGGWWVYGIVLPTLPNMSPLYLHSHDMEWMTMKYVPCFDPSTNLTRHTGAYSIEMYPQMMNAKKDLQCLEYVGIILRA